MEDQQTFTVVNGSVVWPTTVDCEDVFKSACKNRLKNTCTSCDWSFAARSAIEIDHSAEVKGRFGYDQ